MASTRSNNKRRKLGNAQPQRSGKEEREQGEGQEEDGRGGGGGGGEGRKGKKGRTGRGRDSAFGGGSGHMQLGGAHGSGVLFVDFDSGADVGVSGGAGGAAGGDGAEEKKEGEGEGEGKGGRRTVKVELLGATKGSFPYRQGHVKWRLVGSGGGGVVRSLDEEEEEGEKAAGGGGGGRQDTGQGESAAPRLELSYREVDDMGDDAAIISLAMPLGGSEEKQRLLRKRAKTAREQFLQKTAEIEAALKENHLAFERVTSEEDAPPEDILPVSLERQRLKKELRAREEQTEEWFRLEGDCVSFSVGVGEHVAPEGLPGRPSFVFVGCARSVGVERSRWSSDHVAPLGSPLNDPFQPCVI
jgi:hypothetical protein